MKIIIKESKIPLLKKESMTPVILAKVDEISNIVVKVMLAFKEGVTKYLKTPVAKKQRVGFNLNVFNDIILDRKTRIGAKEKIKKGFNPKIENVTLKDIDTANLTTNEKRTLKFLSKKTADPNAVKIFIRDLINSGKLESKIEKEDKMVHPHPIDVTPWTDAKSEYPTFKFDILYKCTITKESDEMNGDANGNSNNMYYSVLNRDVDIFFIGSAQIPDINSPEINFRNKKLKVFFNTKTYNKKVEDMEQYIKATLRKDLSLGMVSNKERMVSNQNLPNPIKNIIEFLWLDYNRQANVNADAGKDSFSSANELIKYWQEFKTFFQENNDPKVWSEVNDELNLVGPEESNDISKIKILFFQKTNEKFQDFNNKAHEIQQNNYLHSDEVNPIAITLLNKQEYSIDTQYGKLHFKINPHNKLIATIFMIDKNGEIQRVMNNHWETVKDAADYSRVFDFYNSIKEEMLVKVIPSRMKNEENKVRPIQTEEDKEKLYHYKLKNGIKQNKAWK